MLILHLNPSHSPELSAHCISLSYMTLLSASAFQLPSFRSSLSDIKTYQHLLIFSLQSETSLWQSISFRNKNLAHTHWLLTSSFYAHIEVTYFSIELFLWFSTEHHHLHTTATSILLHHHAAVNSVCPTSLISHNVQDNNNEQLWWHYTALLYSQIYFTPLFSLSYCKCWFHCKCLKQHPEAILALNIQSKLPKELFC